MTNTRSPRVDAQVVPYRIRQVRSNVVYAKWSVLVTNFIVAGATFATLRKAAFLRAT